ncbi:HAD family hydrolase (plasmid) [Burkholderia ambifaria]
MRQGTLRVDNSNISGAEKRKTAEKIRETVKSRRRSTGSGWLRSNGEKNRQLNSIDKRKMTHSDTAVLFDFDLTLVDSTEAIQFCAQSAMADMNLVAPSSAKVRESIGLTLHDTFRFLTDIDDPTLADTYTTRYVWHADRVMVDMTNFYPPAERLLKELYDRKVSVGIVSTKFRHRIERILLKADLAHCIRTIIGGEDVLCHKPDPEGILKALANMNTAVNKAIYVGDHLIDAEAARAAGTRFIGAITGSLTSESWARIGCMSVTNSIEEVADLIE